jgi:hypothetical protein
VDNEEFVNKLSYRSRLRLSWELTWPLTVLDFAVVLWIHALIRPPDETLDSLWALVAFFGVSPWVVRRALGETYCGLRIVVVRHGEEGPLRYQESLKVMWLLAWRTMVLGLAALLAFSLPLRILGVQTQSLTIHSPLANALGLSALDAVTSLVFTPVLAPFMLRKRYKGFRLELHAVPHPVKSPGPSRQALVARNRRS